MTFHFDREVFFDSVRTVLFAGAMSQSQVDGMDAILSAAERVQLQDNRHIGYMLATTYHETSQTMQPIEEYGKGAGQPYGVTDPETGQAYYGRGFVQLTWRENYARADRELGLTGSASCEWHAGNALDPVTAARVMGIGMEEGWFRSDSAGPHRLARYFNQTTDAPYNAREIINGDKHIVPSWSNGESIGQLITDYYMDFTAALNVAKTSDEAPTPVPEARVLTVIKIHSFGPIQVEIEEDSDGVPKRA